MNTIEIDFAKISSGIHSALSQRFAEKSRAYGHLSHLHVSTEITPAVIHKVLKEACFEILQTSFINVREVNPITEGMSGLAVIAFSSSENEKHAIIKCAVGNEKDIDRLRKEHHYILGLPASMRAHYPHIFLSRASKVEAHDSLFLFMEDISSRYDRLDNALKKDPNQFQNVVSSISKVYSDAKIEMRGAENVEFNLSNYLLDIMNFRIERYHISFLKKYQKGNPERVGELYTRIQDEFKPSFENLLDNEYRAIGFPCHNDMHCKNVFWKQDMNQVMFIDPLGRPRVSSPLIDFGTLFASIALVHKIDSIDMNDAWNIISENEIDLHIKRPASLHTILWACFLVFAILPRDKKGWSSLDTYEKFLNHVITLAQNPLNSSAT